MDNRFDLFTLRKQKSILLKKYLSSSNEYQKSGWNGSQKSWEKNKKIILDAVEKNGSFLDIGCANGILLRDLRI